MNIKNQEEHLINKILNDFTTKKEINYIDSIIITGSFGRHEPTYQYIDNKYILKSDVEIAIIYSNFYKKRYLNKLINDFKQMYKEDLNFMLINKKRIMKVHNFNYSFITPKKKTLFTYDLFNGSYTLYGKDFLKNNFVKIGDIDLYEAKRIVANRIAELVYLSSSPNDNNEFILAQWRAKTILALGTAWLLLNNKYESSYHSQKKLIELNKDKINNFFGDNFYYNYIKCFDLLRNNGEYYLIDNKYLLNYIIKINSLFNDSKLNKSKVNNLARKVKYFLKYILYKKDLNIFNIENRILSDVLVGYINNDNILYKANLWHNVIY